MLKQGQFVIPFVEPVSNRSTTQVANLCHMGDGGRGACLEEIRIRGRLGFTNLLNRIKKRKDESGAATRPYSLPPTLHAVASKRKWHVGQLLLRRKNVR